MGGDARAGRAYGRRGEGARAGNGARPRIGHPAEARRLTLERVVRPTGPYSLLLCIRHASDATRHVRDGTLTTALRIGERVEVASATQLVDGRVVLRGKATTDSNVCGSSSR